MVARPSTGLGERRKMSILSYPVAYGDWSGTINLNYTASYDPITNKSTIIFGQCNAVYSSRFNSQTTTDTNITVAAEDNADSSATATLHTSGYGTGGPVTFTGTPSPSTITVQHSSKSGLKTVKIYASTTVAVRPYKESSLIYAGGKGSVTVTPPSTAVASTISAANGYFGDVLPITINRFDSVYTHTITVACAGISETILNNSPTYPTVNWTPAVATYAPKITSSMEANCVLTCSTYLNGALVGSKSVSITLTLKETDVKPSTAITVEDSAGCVAKYGKYVATKSKLRIALTNTLLYGATAKSVSINANGATYSTNPATTNELLSASYNTVTAQIQDSRSQMSDQVSVDLDVLPYSPPAINSFSVHRCNDDGSANDEGAYCRVDFDVSISPLDDINSRALTCKFKVVSAEEYASGSISLSSYADTGSYVFAADTEQSFDVSLELTDDFSTTTMQTRLSTATVIMAFRAGGLGVGFGKVPEHDYSVEIAANWTICIGDRTLLDYMHPVGSVYISSQPTDPGTLFGGTWTRIKDTFILAAGDSFAAGATGGEATHVLTATEIPNHNSQVFAGTAGSQQMYYTSGRVTTGEAYGFGMSNSPPENSSLIWARYKGGGAAHNNMPPYITRYVWERTA